MAPGSSEAARGSCSHSGHRNRAHSLPVGTRAPSHRPAQARGGRQSDASLRRQRRCLQGRSMHPTRRPSVQGPGPAPAPTMGRRQFGERKHFDEGASRRCQSRSRIALSERTGQGREGPLLHHDPMGRIPRAAGRGHRRTRARRAREPVNCMSIVNTCKRQARKKIKALAITLGPAKCVRETRQSAKMRERSVVRHHDLNSRYGKPSRKALDVSPRRLRCLLAENSAKDVDHAS